MGGPRLVVGGVVPHVRQHLGDKLQELARLSPQDLRAIERVVDTMLIRLEMPPPPLRIKHLRRKSEAS